MIDDTSRIEAVADMLEKVLAYPCSWRDLGQELKRKHLQFALGIVRAAVDHTEIHLPLENEDQHTIHRVLLDAENAEISNASMAVTILETAMIGQGERSLDSGKSYDENAMEIFFANLDDPEWEDFMLRTRST